MAAISKAWVTIADAAVDPDSPGDATLMTGIRDDLVHLREWLGASFFAGAVQDHNHDGVNSALIQVGPNLLRNGSFESDDAGWTITDYSGGSHAFSTSTRHHGAKSLALTSTVLANGGGDALSNEFIPVGGSEGLGWAAHVSASVANVSARMSVVWYDAAQSQISEVNFVDLTNTPSSRVEYSGAVTAPSTARFAKLRVTGGVPGAGSSTGTIFWDGVQFGISHGGLVDIIPLTNLPAANGVTISNIPQGFRALVLELTGVSSDTASRVPTVRVGNDATTANYQGTYTTFAGVAQNDLPSLQRPAAQAAAQISASTIVITGYQEGLSTVAHAAGHSASLGDQFSTLVRHITTTAMTSMTITWNGSGNFDAGTYRLMGVR